MWTLTGFDHYATLATRDAVSMMLRQGGISDYHDDPGCHDFRGDSANMEGNTPNDTADAPRYNSDDSDDDNDDNARGYWLHDDRYRLDNAHRVVDDDNDDDHHRDDRHDHDRNDDDHDHHDHVSRQFFQIVEYGRDSATPPVSYAFQERHPDRKRWVATSPTCRFRDGGSA